MGINHQKVIESESRGERVSAFVTSYLKISGRSLGELAFSIGADKRDMQRLQREKSVGWRLEDKLYAYFGQMFLDEVFAPVGAGKSTRERELERERAEIAARLARLEARRSPVAERPSGLRLVSDESGQADV